MKKNSIFLFLLMVLIIAVTPCFAEVIYFEKGDLNGNGLSDIIMVSGSNVKVYFNSGNFRFEGPHSIYADNAPLALRKGEILKLDDLNNNGRFDIIVMTEAGLNIYRNYPSPSGPVFSKAALLTPAVASTTPSVRAPVPTVSPIQTATEPTREIQRIRPQDIMLPAPQLQSNKNKIAFLDFKFMNPQRDENSWLATGIPDFIYFFVPENINLKTIPRGEVKGKSVTISNVATSFEDVKYVVTGDFYIQGESLEIKMSVIDMDTVNVVLEKTAIGQRDNVYPVIEDLGDSIREFFEMKGGTE